MHKTSLLCAFLARMRAALCLLENKHLRASEPSDSTSLFFFCCFFRHCDGERAEGKERHADQTK